MSRWTCPHCDREFGRAHQAHTCVPGQTVDESFAGRPPWQRAIYDRIEAHLSTMGPVHADAVRVGVFLKTDRKLATVRPRVRSVALAIALRRRIDHPRIARIMPMSAGRYANVVNLTAPSDVDELVEAWLTEAYVDATDPEPA